MALRLGFLSGVGRIESWHLWGIKSMTFILLGDDTDDEMEHELYDELSRAIEAMIISWQPLHVRVHNYRHCTYHRKNN